MGNNKGGGVLLVGGAVGVALAALVAAVAMAQQEEPPSDVELTILDKEGNPLPKHPSMGIGGGATYDFVEGETYSALATVTNSSVRGPDALPWEATITTVIRLTQGDQVLDEMSDTRLFAAGETLAIPDAAGWQFTIPYDVGGSTGRIEAGLFDPAGNVILGADGLPAQDSNSVNYIGAELVYAFTGMSVLPSGGSLDEGQDYILTFTTTNASARGGVIPEAVSVTVRLTLYWADSTICATQSTVETFGVEEIKTVSMPFHLPYDAGFASVFASGEILDGAGTLISEFTGETVSIMEVPIVWAFDESQIKISVKNWGALTGSPIYEGLDILASIYLAHQVTRGGVPINGVPIRVEHAFVIAPGTPNAIVITETDVFTLNYNEGAYFSLRFTAPYGTVPVGAGSLPATYTAEVFNPDGNLIKTLQIGVSIIEVPVEYRGGITI